MAYEVLNGQVTDDVTWPRKVKLVTSIRLERNISKTAEDAKSNNRLLVDMLRGSRLLLAILATA